MHALRTLPMTLQLNAIASFGMTPDMTFLLDLPVSVGIKRALKRNEASAESGQDRFEKEQLKFHKAVREGYLDLARKNRKRFVVLDADQEIAKLEDVIFSHLKPHLPSGKLIWNQYYFSDIKGQQKAKRFLENVMGRRRIPHAWLFHGHILASGKLPLPEHLP